MRKTIRTLCTQGSWGGMGVDRSKSAPIQGNEWGEGRGAEAAAGDRSVERIKCHIEESRIRIPRQHEDAEKQANTHQKTEERELKTALQTPGDLPPYEPDLHPSPPEVVNINALNYIQKFSSQTTPTTKKKRATTITARYKRYKTALNNFKDNRIRARVTKLQRVVASGLATEHDYNTELKRLNLNPVDYPLLFTPSPYRSVTGEGTLRDYMSRIGRASHDGLLDSDPEYLKVELLISENLEARTEWMEIQEQVTRVLEGCSKLSAGNYSPLKDPHYYELVRNIHARRTSFFAAYSLDAVSPRHVGLLNHSCHGLLHEKFFSVPLFSPSPLSAADLDHCLAVCSQGAFNAKCRDTFKSIIEKENPTENNSEARVATTRIEWLEKKKNTQGSTWGEKKKALAELKMLQEQREADNSPDYQIVYSTGDMGVKPDGKSFSLHPSSSMEYILEKPVTA